MELMKWETEEFVCEERCWERKRWRWITRLILCFMHAFILSYSLLLFHHNTWRRSLPLLSILWVINTFILCFLPLFFSWIRSLATAVTSGLLPLNSLVASGRKEQNSSLPFPFWLIPWVTNHRQVKTQVILIFAAFSLFGAIIVST